MNYYDDEPNDEALNDMAATTITQEPTKMVVSIDGMSLGNIEDRIADILVRHPDFGMERIRKRVDEAATKAIDAVITEFAHAKMTEILTKALEQGIPVTNTYGESTGKTVTIRARLEEIGGKAWLQPVDEKGRPYSGSRTTLADYLIKTHGIDPVLANAKAEVERIATEAKKQVAAAVGNFIAQNLAAPVIAHAAAQLPKV